MTVSNATLVIDESQHGSVRLEWRDGSLELTLCLRGSTPDANHGAKLVLSESLARRISLFLQATLPCQ